MIKLEADLHIHTVASGHAYSTILEIAKAASQKGLKMIGVTDHGPAMPGGPHPYHFANMRVLPEEIDGVRILKGVEANVINESGELDLDEVYLKRLDIVLAGFHARCFPSSDTDICTRAMLNAMDNPYVDIIVHPGNPEFPVDFEAVVKKSAEKGIALEINNSSFCGSRKGSIDNCCNIASLIAHHKSPVVISSDAHIAFDVGRFEYALAAAVDAGIKEEQVLNTSIEKILSYLGRSKR